MMDFICDKDATDSKPVFLTEYPTYTYKGIISTVQYMYSTCTISRNKLRTHIKERFVCVKTSMASVYLSIACAKIYSSLHYSCHTQEVIGGCLMVL